MSPFAIFVAATLVAAPQVETGDDVRPAEVVDDSAATPDARAPAAGSDSSGSQPAQPAQPAQLDADAAQGDTAVGLDPVPLPHRPSAELIKRRRAEARRGRILTIAGATLTGIGLAGRIGIDVFLATVADLAPREPFGQWSVGPLVMATTFSNVPTLAGIGLLGGGSYYQARAHGRRFDHPSSRRTKRAAWGLLGGGLGLWAVSRALFVPWTRACESNACAYGYLEPTYFVSAGLVVSGVVLLARESGFARAEAEETADYIKIRARRPTPSISPVVAPGFQGLSVSGRF